MEFLDDIEKSRGAIQAAINKYGYAPEHNIEWYACNTEPAQNAIVAVWSDQTALLTHKEKNEWYVFSEPVMPVSNAGIRIAEFASRAFEDSTIKKIVFELRKETRKAVLRALPKTLRACAINYTLIWPIMDMELFDPALPGGHWKHIRNANGKFYREHRVEMIDAQNVPPCELFAIIDRWKERRGGGDRAFWHEYRAIIEKHFAPATHAHAMTVDNHVVGLNVGWRIPNTNQYYAAIGIHDYSAPDLGMMLYLEDLKWFKRSGMRNIDMGGGEKQLTQFKNQFLPARWYKTFVFSVVRR
jgi:hypothetical protein